MGRELRLTYIHIEQLLGAGRPQQAIGIYREWYAMPPLFDQPPGVDQRVHFRGRLANQVIKNYVDGRLGAILVRLFN